MVATRRPSQPDPFRLMHVDAGAHDQERVALSDRVVQYDPSLDGWRRYLTDSPTPKKLGALVKDIDTGDYAALVELTEEIESKDERIQSALGRRRGSLTTPEWRVEPDPKATNKPAAVESAAFCQRELDRLKDWTEIVDHNATAIGPGLALTELIWWRGRLVDLVIVPGDRLSGDPQAPPMQVNIQTQEHYGVGVPAVSPKFLVNRPHLRSGYPLRVTPTRAVMFLWIMKHYARSDWAAFAEKFGMPHVIAQYDTMPGEAKRTKLRNLIRGFGQDHWAMLPKDVEVQLMEASRNVQPFEGIIDWCDKTISILILGQTLTTEQGERGALALGNVHANVEASIALSDISHESSTLRQQVLAPMVRFRFPENPLMPIPVWRRQVVMDPRIDERRLDMDVFKYFDERELAIDDAVRYERLNVPMPTQEVA